MPDSKERIAADILIAMIEKEKYGFSREDSETTEILTKAFSEIYKVINLAEKND